MTTTEIKTKKPRATKVPTKVGDKVSKPKISKVVGKKEKSSDKEDGKVVLRIRVRAYESKILDSSIKQIMDTAARHD